MQEKYKIFVRVNKKLLRWYKKNTNYITIYYVKYQDQ